MTTGQPDVKKEKHSTSWGKECQHPEKKKELKPLKKYFTLRAIL